MNNSLTLILPGLVVAVVGLVLFLVEAFVPAKRVLAYIAAAGLALAGVLAASSSRSSSVPWASSPSCSPTATSTCIVPRGASSTGCSC
jgi:NADH:ubiquinone oxidoreductase subunit 2 (subunit N)